MTRAQHGVLIAVCFLAWLIFLILGLPSDYYLNSPLAAKILISLGTFLAIIPLLALGVLRAIKPADYFRASLIFCVYATLGIFVLDLLYCGLYQGYGLSFLSSHWPQTLGYIYPWFEVPLIGWLMQRRSAQVKAG